MPVSNEFLDEMNANDQADKSYLRGWDTLASAAGNPAAHASPAVAGSQDAYIKGMLHAQQFVSWEHVAPEHYSDGME